MKISSFCIHHGEEPFISGTKGSGAIFFSNCTMRCIYCQNWQISFEGQGKIMGVDEVVVEMLSLQEQGCYNINLVSPTQYAREIVDALTKAKSKGLKIPIVYNTNGYDRLSILKMFEGLIDIYLPDIKYSDNKVALELSGVSNYVEQSREAIKEMFRQVGDLELDKHDIAKRGLIVRHLVLPEDLAGSYKSLGFLSSLSKELWVSIMSQYHPCYKAIDHPILKRRITKAEYDQVLEWAGELGLRNILTQDLSSHDVFIPDFEKKKPFSNN